MLYNLFFYLGLTQAQALFTDTWINWAPNNKVYDVVCFSKTGGDKIFKNIRVLSLNRKSFQYREEGVEELQVAKTKNCFFEQKESHAVSRDEFFEEIISIHCNMNSIPFADGDFRILGTNNVTTSVKRLRDGKIWILPTNDCSFTTQLPKKEILPSAPPAPMDKPHFPGEEDQFQSFEINPPKPPPGQKKSPPALIEPEPLTPPPVEPVIKKGRPLDDSPTRIREFLRTAP